MTNWEYKVVGNIDNLSLEQELNKLGKEGWEVVAGAGGGSYDVSFSQFVLKRPL